MRRLWVFISVAASFFFLAGCTSSTISSSEGSSSQSSGSTNPGTGSSGTQSSSSSSPTATVADACTLLTLNDVSAAFGQTATSATKPEVQSGPLKTCQWIGNTSNYWLIVELTQANAQYLFSSAVPAASGATYAAVTITGADQAKEHDDAGVIEIVAIKGGSFVHASFNPINGVSLGDSNAQALVAKILSNL